METQKVTKLGAHGLHVMVPKDKFNEGDEVVVTRPEDKPKENLTETGLSQLANDSIDKRIHEAIRVHENELH